MNSLDSYSAWNARVEEPPWSPSLTWASLVVVTGPAGLVHSSLFFLLRFPSHFFRAFFPPLCSFLTLRTAHSGHCCFLSTPKAFLYPLLYFPRLALPQISVATWEGGDLEDFVQAEGPRAPVSATVCSRLAWYHEFLQLCWQEGGEP